MLLSVFVVGFILFLMLLFFLYRRSAIKLLISSLLILTTLIYSTLISIILKEGGKDFFERMFSNDFAQDVEAPIEKMKGTQINAVVIKDRVLIDAPIIKQFPELPRGCEVTSLAMLLQYRGIETDKMELAAKIKKNTTPLSEQGGVIYWGNPNKGFIGDMYSYNNPGYGVYHEAVKELADQYLPGEIVDLTGKEFEELKTFLSLDIPVWVITNTTYKTLPETSFESWKTPEGDIRITYKEHSVLITGYDDQNIYFNDPISGEKNKAILKEDFIDAWKQMGSQAVTFLPEQE